MSRSQKPEIFTYADFDLEALSMPSEIGRKILASEVVTLLYLRAHSDILAPELFDYCTTSKNDIRIPFILMSEPRGVPLLKFWTPANPSESNLCDKAKILSQLSAITWKLSYFQITECLSRSHVFNKRVFLDIPRGPFYSENKFYNSAVSAFLEHAETLNMSHHCFVAPVPKQNEYDTHSEYIQAVDLWNDFMAVGCKTESSTNRLDYVIVASTLRELIQRLGLATDNSNSFPLYHADLSVNNIYVDEDFNITCIIDWGFASSVPEFMLLAPPDLPQLRDEISQELYKPFSGGFLSAIPEFSEKTLAYRYQNLLGFSQDFVHGPSKDLEHYLLAQRPSDHFSQIYRRIQQDDMPTSQIKRDEQEYFDNKTLRYTIAKKLTLISEWGTQHDTTNSPRFQERVFLADSRLWKSIMQSMQDCEDIS
ncbi:hypothetical protein BJX68DRAFT_256522 [Aspergillus pseudodeflectus]|uniref:Aminoglycoside phosphotransferase domain-containing protein n=1 Tax=Aspergillus pseudodeflectus TaxID=176178 RepID=A0ABR4K507_9EURO